MNIQYQTKSYPSVFAVSIVFGGGLGLTTSQLFGHSGGGGFLLGTAIVFLVLSSLVLFSRSQGAYIEDLQTKQYQLLMDYHHRLSNDAYKKGDLDEAIRHCEEYLKCAEKAWGKEPKSLEQWNILLWRRNNLAYFYAEKGTLDKKGEAIRYAKTCLEAGLAADDLNLIDTYLYVVMRFGGSIEDMKKWAQIYETYKDRLREEGIRGKTEEQIEYSNYYEKIRAAV